MSYFFKLKRLRFYPWLSSLLILLIVVVVYGWALRGLKLDFELLRSGHTSAILLPGYFLPIGKF
jgi:phosphonate transport system permease protein